MTNRNKALLLGSAAFAAVAGIALAQEAGVQSVIGNVFLQNITPGTAQVGHATITGTFRAGQVFVQQGSTATIPIVGNNTAVGEFGTLGGSFSAAGALSTALRATATNQDGATVGVDGISRGGSGVGVRGTGGTGVFGIGQLGAVPVGGLFAAAGPSARAVQAQSSDGATGVRVFQNTAVFSRAIHCTFSNNAPDAVGGEFDLPLKGVGVKALVRGTVGGGTGVFGESRASDNGTGVLGVADDAGSSIGVHGVGESPTGFGVFSIGNTGATGTKSFVIDHPLDPERRYLKHYSAEGPEPRNVYQGTVVTGGDGFAWVRLPDYYESINRDPLVQLTVVDGSDDFVQVKVASDVSQGRFQVRTSKGRVRVNWRVDAVRNDGWVRLNGAESEPAKPQAFQGTYLQPKVYGKPESKAQWKRPNDGQRSPRP